MIQIRKSNDRGHFNFGWLDTYHTFSFGEYYDPAHMGFSALRVINEDRVAPGGGFGTHPHRDMEIITCVLSGVLEHKDSMGNGSLIKPGEVQKLSAGTGITHSEYNHSKSEPVHLLQIWILPERKGVKPGYEQRDFSNTTPGQLHLVASRGGENKSIHLHQDARLYLATFRKGDVVSHPTNGRSAWLQVAAGEVEINGQPLSPGDACAVTNEARVELKAASSATALLFDLP